MSLPDFNQFSHADLLSLVGVLQKHIVDTRQELIEKCLGASTTHISILLENLYQEHNASAILRNCDSFGVREVHAVEYYNEFQARTGIAVSADKWVNLYKWNGEDALESAVTKLKSEGRRIVATTLREGAVPIHELSVKEPIALMFGTELGGLSERAHELADEYVYVPMEGFVQSLNVSCATAICMQNLVYRTKSQVSDWPVEDKYADALRVRWYLESMKGGDNVLERYLKDLGIQA